MRSFVFIAVFLVFLPTYVLAKDKDPLGFENAAVEYRINLELLMAISSVESSHNVSAINPNTYDGNPDQGHMQIHSGTWRESLGEVRWKRMLEDPKFCTLVGAWVLRGYINQYGNNWNAVCAYHTGSSLDQLRERAKTGIKKDVERYKRGQDYVQKVQVAMKRYQEKGATKNYAKVKRKNIEVASAEKQYWGEDDRPLRSNY